jgi:hypothetical protein
MEHEKIVSAMQKANTMITQTEKLRQKVDRKLATKFSIFNFGYIKESYNERMLSEIIAFILNPQQTHGQGAIFMREFLKMLVIEFFNPNKNKVKITYFSNLNSEKTECKDCVNDKNETAPFASLYWEELVKPDSDLEKATVKCEVFIDGRPIDIVVTVGERKFAIENKIGAGDQSCQVCDYLRKNDFLIYLSKDGDEPTDVSIKKVKRIKEMNIGRLLLMKHKDGHNDSAASIYTWLKRCAQISESEKIRWYIQEAMEWIDNKIYEKEKFMGENLEIFLENNDVFYTYIKLKDEEKYLKSFLLNKLFMKLKDMFDERMINSEWKSELNKDKVLFGNNDNFFYIKNKNGSQIFYITFKDNAYNVYFKWIFGNMITYDQLKEVFPKSTLEKDGVGAWEYIEWLMNCNTTEMMRKFYEFNKNPVNHNFVKEMNELADKITGFLRKMNATQQQV